MTKKLSYCRKFGFSRLVYAHGGDHIPVAAPKEEELALQKEREDVETHRQRVMGFELTNPFDGEIEWVRLGMREDAVTILDKKFPDKKNRAKPIIEKKVNDRLQHMLKERQKKKGTWERTKEWARERASLNPAKWFRQSGGIKKMLKEEFGANPELEKKRDHIGNLLVTKVLGGLPQSELDAICTTLGHPIGASPIEVGQHLTSAIYPTLRLVRLNHEAVFANAKQDLENLLELRRAEAEEYENTLSPEKFNPVRLRKFLMELKEGKCSNKTTVHPDEQEIYTLITEQILPKGALDSLDTDRNAKAVVAETYYFFQSHERDATGPNVAEVKKQLEKIRDGLKVKAAPTDDAKKSAHDKTIEKMEDYRNKFTAAVNELAAIYSEARSLERTIAELEREKKKINDELNPTTPAGGPPPPPLTSDNIKGINKRLELKDVALDRERGKRASLHKQVGAAEKVYKANTEALVNFLIKVKKLPTPPTSPSAPAELVELYAGIGKKESELHELYRSEPPGGGAASVDGSELEQHFTNLNRDFLNKFMAYGEEHMNTLRAREKLSPRAFLVKLKEAQLTDEPDETRRSRLANLAANLAIADVRTIEINKAGNAMTIQSILGKRLKLRTPKPYKTIGAMEIFKRVGKMKGLKELKDIKPFISLEETRRLLAHKSVNDLIGMGDYLEQVLVDKKLDRYRNAKISGASWPLANVLTFLHQIYAELDHRELEQQLAFPDSEEDKAMNKADLRIKLINQRDQAERALRKSIYDKVRDENGEYSDLLRARSALLAKFGDLYNRLAGEAKAKGLTGRARKEYIREGGVNDYVQELIMGTIGSMVADKVLSPLGSWAKKKIKNGATAAYGKIKKIGGDLYNFPSSLYRKVTRKK